MLKVFPLKFFEQEMLLLLQLFYNLGCLVQRDKEKNYMQFGNKKSTNKNLPIVANHIPVNEGNLIEHK